MPNLDELGTRRQELDRRIRARERDILEPYIGQRKCLSTTFPPNTVGTVETLPADVLPENYSRNDLYQIVLRDPEWKALIAEVQELQRAFDIFLEDRNVSNTTYREQIIVIKQELGLSDYSIAKFLGCRMEYARQFSASSSVKADIQERRPLDARISRKVRQHVLDRDQNCVRCQSDSNLEMHHIIPVSHGGESYIDNLALLCHRCHFLAHGDSWDGPVAYKSIGEFWAWIKEG